ncbi:MAG: rane protein [Eubacterium sp.]|nr:rane protein [Eubacterium sp.]
MTNFNDLLLFFTIYSFLGWAMETIFASINERKFINRGFLSGFFCPIYGSGAVLILWSSKLVANVFENHLTALIISLLFSVILVTVLEYITGFLLEKFFNCKWWDYSDNAFNIQGYICLKYSLLWGLMTLLLQQVVHPAIAEVIFSIPLSVRGYLAVFMLLYFMADSVKSIIDTLDLRKVILDASNISSNKYYEKIIQYKRFFYAFPQLLILNAGIINRDIRSILNEKMDKIKVELKSRFLQ